MDEEMVVGMIFTLLLGLMVGGFVLLYPLSRRVAILMERRFHDKDPVPRPSTEELDALRQSVAELSTQIDRLVDRQDFMEKLLSQRMDPRPLGAVSQQK
jgi:hypothetical protein